MSTQNMGMDNFAGWTDQANQEIVSGWCTNMADPDKPANVLLYVNEVNVATVTCENVRDDAVAAGYVGARHFTIPVKPFLRPGQNVIHVYFDNTNNLLPNGHHVITVSSSENESVGNYWSTQYTQKKTLTTRWWESDYIVRAINKRVCGEAISGASAGLHQLALQRFQDKVPFTHAVSIGAGTGTHERHALQCGLVQQFTLYELSASAVEIGRKEAEEHGLADRMHFRLENGMECETQDEQYDMVYWNNALHHMFDVKAALEWSWRVLKKGGVLLMDDFVGANRMQWSDWLLNINTNMRNSIPGQYLRHPTLPGYVISSVAVRADPAIIIAADPSECVDSARILPELLRLFPDAWVKKTGGGIYHVGLSDILHNILEDQDFALLDQLMALDDYCVEMGETHYAVALAVK